MTQQRLYRKPGQIWRLRHYVYPLRPGSYLIIGFQRIRQDYASGNPRLINDTNWIRLRNMETGRERSIQRRSLTTRENRWEFIGMDDAEPRNLVVRCTQCGSADVQKLKYPLHKWVCPDCRK